MSLPLLNGQTAIVTGAGSGIGAATAVLFANSGASVLVTGRKPEPVEATAASIRDSGGVVDVLLGDLTDSSFCDALIEEAVQRFGSLDILANVAGTITRGDVTETTDEQWRQNLTVNTDSVFFCSRAAIRAMRQNRQAVDGGGRGVIVNIASNVGMVGAAGLPAYCASKGAVIQLTKAMALDHAAEGIRVNALCPGAVDTPMLISEHAGTGLTPEQVFERNVAAIPEGRIPLPEEIAKSMLYLASDLSSHVTGVALAIDGGYVAQ